MKKLGVLCLALALMLNTAACTGGMSQNPTGNLGTSSDGLIGSQNTQKESESTEPESTEYTEETETEPKPQPPLPYTNATELLDYVWKTYEEAEQFGIVGGHHNAYVKDAPAAYDMTMGKDIEELFCFPESDMESVTDMASMQHGINISYFTAVAYHLNTEALAEELATHVQERIQNHAWTFDKPDCYVLYSVRGEYLIMAYGNWDYLETFKNHFEEQPSKDYVICAEENL